VRPKARPVLRSDRVQYSCRTLRVVPVIFKSLAAAKVHLLRLRVITNFLRTTFSNKAAARQHDLRSACANATPILCSVNSIARHRSTTGRLVVSAMKSLRSHDVSSLLPKCVLRQLCYGWQVRGQRTTERQPVFLVSIEGGSGCGTPAPSSGIEVNQPSAHCGILTFAPADR
jgi:hypothetical protein